MSSGAELHFSRSAVELQPIDMIHAKKDEQRCRRHATKMQLSEASLARKPIVMRHADPGLTAASVREAAVSFLVSDSL